MITAPFLLSTVSFPLLFVTSPATLTPLSPLFETVIVPLLFVTVPLFTVVFPFAVVRTVSTFTPPAVLLTEVFPFLLTTSPVICIPCEPLFVIFSSPSVFSTLPRLVI